MESKILHAELFDKIIESLKRGENVQLTGLRGLGKSRLLRDVEDNQPDGLSIYRSDLGLISDRSTYSILKFIFGSILGLEKLRAMGPGELSSEIHTYFKDIHKEGKKIVLLLDSFDKLKPDSETLGVFNFLNALHTQCPGTLSFVFGVEKPLTIENNSNNYGDFGKLIFGKVFYITPLTKDESDLFIDIQISEGLEIKLTEDQRNKIIEASGGYMFVIKRLIQGISAGEKLDELIANPSIFPALAYSCELAIAQINDNAELAKKYYVKDANDKFICRVFENYLKNKSTPIKTAGEDDLTASEYKILDFLKKNKGKLCSREDIIVAVWGDGIEKGISDHALDQIISRLRKKLTGLGQKVETIRGRGHRLLI